VGASPTGAVTCIGLSKDGMKDGGTEENACASKDDNGQGHKTKSHSPSTRLSLSWALSDICVRVEI
jgi:hypothetical protein